MNALLHYQSALLLRSQRWLAPVILYAAFLAVGVQSGQPVLDSLAYAAAALLPVAAWIVRICVTNEPPSARSCTAAAAGPWRAHLATLLSAFLASAVLGVVATVVVAVISDAASTDHRTAVNRIAASGAGLLAMLVSALLGTAIGAVTNWPLLRSPAWAISVLLLAALLALVTTGSPAQAVLTDLITGSRDGVVPVPLLPVAGAGALAAAAVATACGLASRRG
ncbi:ABC transporter [Streptomyces sp. NBC_01381]|uniref:ABC transporter n=1 Tax=Streptomyces sp. NBC_01381 TaxID=2903845 RepID=UPI0022589540|nr:ABC transporter [Streptomyces sp. NBC_01381]MCX4670731.1 ABC transporter [Streptomyces sp. NBC_01381]